MLRLVIVCVAALGVLQVTACSGTPCPPPPERTLSIGCVESKDALRLDRGDWQVSRRTAVWKVLASRPDRPPVLVGYVTQRKYRQLRGGPEYAIYEVSRLDRRDLIGRIDQMGRTWRIEPSRDSGFEETDLGVMDLELGVQEIFENPRPMILEPTTERRLAFEMLDKDGSGYLERAETEGHGDRLATADRDGDGRLGFEEFDAIDTL